MQRKPFVIACLAAAILAIGMAVMVASRKPGVPAVASAPRPAATRTPAVDQATPRPVPSPAGEKVPAGPEPSAEAAARETIRLSGTVFDEATRLPLAGATVGIYPAKVPKSICDEPEAVNTTTTDAEGRFAIDYVRPGASAWDYLGVRAPGYTEALRLTRAFDPQGSARDVPPDGFNIGMKRGTDLEVRVVADDDGSPVTGAKVVFSQNSGIRPGDEAQSVVFRSSRGTTGASGVCTVADAGGKGFRSVAVCAEGFLPYQRMMEEGEQPGSLEVRMVRCHAAIEGYVLDVKGSPVEKATIYVNGEQADGNTFANMYGTTNAEGYYSIPCVAAGALKVYAGTTQDQSFGPGAEATLEKGEKRRIDFREEEMGVAFIAGKVTRKDTGKPFSGIKLSLNRWGPAPSDSKSKREFGEATSGADGTYKMKVPVPPSGGRQNGAFVHVEVPEGFVLASERYYSGQSGLYVNGITLGETLEQDFVLAPARTVRGVVVMDADDQPVSGATVLYQQRKGMRMTTRYGSTKADGSFEFQVDEVTPGEISARTETALGFVELPDPPGEGPFTVRLRPGATVSGAVLDESESPVAGVELMVMVDPNSSPGFGRRVSQPRQTTTGKDGTFLFEGVEEGSLVLSGTDRHWAEKRKGAPEGVVEPVRLRISPGERKEGVIVRLVTGFCVRGIVVDEDGNPVSEVQVNANSWDGPGMVDYRQPAMTKADGRFEICNLQKDGKYQVQGWKSGYDSEAVEGITNLAGEITLTMRKTPQLRMKVLREGTREPVKSIEWRTIYSGVIGGPSPDMASGSGKEKSENGEYLLKPNNRIDGGQYLLVAELDASGKGTGFRGGAKLTSLEEEVVVMVGKGRSIRGRVVKPGDPPTPIAGAKVEVSNPNARYSMAGQPVASAFEVAPVQSDAAGNFTMRGIGSGRYNLKATKGDLTSSWVPVEVAPGADPEPVTIEMLGLGRVFGKVTGPDGGPLAGAVIQIGPMMTPVEQHQTATSDASGRYEIRDIVPFEGGYLSVKAMDGLLEQGTSCLIVPGEEWEYNFDFSGLVRLRGRITVNGQPPPARRSFMITGPEGTNGRMIETVDADGRFDALVPSGEAHLAMSASGVTMRDAVPPFDLPASPFEQTRNFDINVFPAAVAIVLPSGMPMPGGVAINVWVEPPGEKMTPVQLGQVSQTEIAVPFARAGLAYAVLYKTDGSGVIARSPKVQIAPGAENILVVTVGE